MNPPRRLICTLALISALAVSACARSERSGSEGRRVVPGRATVEPWKPVDKSFTGCAGG